MYSYEHKRPDWYKDISTYCTVFRACRSPAMCYVTWMQNARAIRSTINDAATPAKEPPAEHDQSDEHTTFYVLYHSRNLATP